MAWSVDVQVTDSIENRFLPLYNFAFPKTEKKVFNYLDVAPVMTGFAKFSWIWAPSTLPSNRILVSWHRALRCWTPDRCLR